MGKLLHWERGIKDSPVLGLLRMPVSLHHPCYSAAWPHYPFLSTLNECTNSSELLFIICCQTWKMFVLFTLWHSRWFLLSWIRNAKEAEKQKLLELKFVQLPWTWNLISIKWDCSSYVGSGAVLIMSFIMN